MARKAATPKVIEPTPNLTVEMFLEFANKVSSMKQTLDDASSRYRESLKRAKGAGINEAVLRQALQLRKTDLDKVNTNFKDLNRYLVWLGVPAGVQLGLFEGATLATTIENARLASAPNAELGEDVKATAYFAGHANGKIGKNRDTNPHGAGELYDEWDRGWIAGQSELADGPAEGAQARMKRSRRNDSERVTA